MSDTGSSDQRPEDRHPGPTSPESGAAGGTPPPPPPPSEGGGAPPPPPPPAGGTLDRTGQAADLGVRIGARLIDFILLAIVGTILTGFLIEEPDSMNVLSAGTSMGALLANLINTIIGLAYFTYLESARGQTLGKQLLKLRVVGPDGGDPTTEQALRRNLWLAAGVIPTILGALVSVGLVIWIIITISNAADKRGVHDQWGGGTQVVRA